MEFSFEILGLANQAIITEVPKFLFSYLATSVSN